VCGWVGGQAGWFVNVWYVCVCACGKKRLAERTKVCSRVRESVCLCVLVLIHDNISVLLHIRTRYITRMNQHVPHVTGPCYSSEYVESQMRICRVTLLNMSCHTCEYVTSLVKIRHVTHTGAAHGVRNMNTSCHKCEYAKSLMQNTSRHPHRRKQSALCLPYEYVMSHIRIR